MNTLHVNDFKAMLETALKNISKRELEFSELDAVCGDGDHGTAIVAAMEAFVEASKPEKEFQSMLMNIAMEAMMKTSGSTSTLIGALFIGMSDNAKGEEIDAESLKAAFKSGLSNVQKQTPAKVGDKTMMDTLVPAVDAISVCESNDVVEILETGAKAALAGAESTISLKANFGRARNLGEKSVGHADPGAASWACMFQSFAQTVKA